MNNLYILIIGGVLGLISCLSTMIAVHWKLKRSRALLQTQIEQAEKDLVHDVEQIDTTELRQTKAGRELLAYSACREFYEETLPEYLLLELEQEEITFDLVRFLLSRLNTERERVVVVEGIMGGMSPYEIQAKRPDLFPSIAAVRVTKHRALRQLRHDREFDQYLERWTVRHRAGTTDQGT